MPDGNQTAVHPYILDSLQEHGIRFKKGIGPDIAMQVFKNGLKKSLSPEVIAAFGGEHRNSARLSVEKAFSQPSTATSGLAQYDLEQGARLLYPVTTILRNMIPRITGGTGIQSNWRSVTAINPSKLSAFLSEGHRGGFVDQTVVDKFAAFKTCGLDNFVTEQAYLAAVTFEDLYALAQTITLQSLMEQEEQQDIGGNTSIALGTTPTPAQNGTATTGGSLSNGTYYFTCAALTYFGMRNSTPPTTQATAPVGGAVALPYTRQNADGSSDVIQGFCGIASAEASVTLSGGTATQLLKLKVAAVNGAIGYAWFASATSGATRLVGITGNPTFDVPAMNSTGQLVGALPAGDTSQNSLAYDGLLTQILASGSGAYVKDLAGAALTTSGSGSGGIAEWDTLIADRIANYRLVPTDIFMSPGDQQKLRATILTGNTNLAPFFMAESSEDGIAAAAQAKVYNNPVGFSTPRLDIHAHPFIPDGTQIFYSRTNPYPLSNVPNLIRKLCRRDYWSVEWPVVTMQRTMGVYFDGVLQLYFPPAFGVITGVKM